MEKKKPKIILRVKIKGEIYDRVYGINDIKNVIDLFNGIHQDQMKISIEQVEIVKKDDH
jgi:hypothetical protein